MMNLIHLTLSYQIYPVAVNVSLSQLRHHDVSLEMQCNMQVLQYFTTSRQQMTHPVHDTLPSNSVRQHFKWLVGFGHLIHI